MSTDPPLDERARLLIEQAYLAAQARGKDDWTRMTLGVLKNRLLQLSDRTFDEAAYGVDSFQAFLELYPDLVRVDETTRPLVVEFISAEASTEPKSGSSRRRERIRPDLWNAVVDYRSGSRYVWEPSEQRAIAVDADEEDSRTPLPTLTAEELSAWRQQFVEGQFEPESCPQEVALWAERGLSVATLPHALRGEWNAFQRDRILRRLATWFEESAVPPPTDILRSEASSARPATTSDVRRFLMRCLEHMTDAEIADLQIPVHVAHRVATSGNQ